jgi:single-stranded-DNA-specific exonuclease
MKKQLTIRSSEGWENLPKTWPDCLRRVMAARGITQPDDVLFELGDLPQPNLLKGMSDAVDVLFEALKKQHRVLIVGDFDSDGATSCALAMTGLKAIGFNDVDFVVPNRFIHGYGLTSTLLQTIDKQALPDVIITVDNGIAAHEGVAYAKSLGIKVIITDHHLPAETLPDADAIINPNQSGDTFPSQYLAGVGVCFYLLLGLRQFLREQNWFNDSGMREPNIAQWLDYVALGTVADVVPLDRLNRTLVEQGLKRIRQGRACLGIKALMKVAGKGDDTISSTDLAFYIAPRLNAAGRMEDMRFGIQLLLTQDPQQAAVLASQLDFINQERRSVEQTMQADAEQILDTIEEDINEQLGLCLFDENWHQGVTGLLASRLKTRFYRPVVIFAPGEDGLLKGSARSIPGVHIRDVLVRVASLQPDCLSKYGGHAMAAGMTIEANQLDTFKQAYQKALSEVITADLLEQEVQSDGELAIDEFNIELAEQIERVAPWGHHFEAPLFHGQFVVNEVRLVGQDQSHLKLNVTLPDGQTVDAIGFSMAVDKPERGDEVLMTYRLSSNTFRNRTSLQLIIDHLFAADSLI